MKENEIEGIISRFLDELYKVPERRHADAVVMHPNTIKQFKKYLARRDSINSYKDKRLTDGTHVGGFPVCESEHLDQDEIKFVKHIE